jgi:hypothetical protein
VRWQKTLRLFHLLQLLLLVIINHTHFVTHFLLTTQRPCSANGHAKEMFLEMGFTSRITLFQATSLNQQCALAEDVAPIPLTPAFITGNN